jgi:sugar phosphate permease
LPVSNIIGAPVSGFILDHAHWAGIASWRWLLIVEGVPAIVCGVLTFFVLPSRPEDAEFLSEPEKYWISEELAREARAHSGDKPVSPLRALAHQRVWQLAGALFGYDVGLYGMTFFLPQAMKALSGGYSNTVVGTFVIIPHVAGLVSMILVSRHSDRTLERRYHAAIPLASAGVALLLLGVFRTPAISIALWCLAAMGLYSFFGPFFSMPSRFLAGYSAASGIALINSVGNLGGFFGPSVVGLMAGGKNGIYGGLAIASLTLFFSAAMALIPETNRETKRISVDARR